jgi:phosphatidylserine decarboxylase
MSTLPLKAMSRLWGRFNELQIPYYLRVPGFKLYSFIFGVKYEFTYSIVRVEIDRS